MEQILNFIIKNKNRLIWTVLGLLFGILSLTIGFFKTVFLYLCVFLGYYIGGIPDKREKLIEILDKILPIGFK